MKRIVIVMAGVLLLAARAGAAILYVWTNSPFPGLPHNAWSNAAHTIQAAVDAASGGDLVLVTNGTYSAGGRVTPGGLLTNRVCLTHAITVRSVNGLYATRIVGAADPVSTNGPAAVRCAFLTNGASLVGFWLSGGHTRTNGTWPQDTAGGAALLLGGSISNCVLSDSEAYQDGGGAAMWPGSEIWNSYIQDNRIHTANGGGVYVRYGGRLRSCLVRRNDASASSGQGLGGGLCLSQGGEAENCTIATNRAKQGGGVYTYSGGTNVNNIIWGNTSTNDTDNWGFNAGAAMTGRYEYCCTTPGSGLPGGTGCFTNYPGFRDGDFHLAGWSPCLEAGTNLPWHASGKDLEGWPRLLGPNVDMGCHEYPLRVTNTVPANGALNVATNATLTARFLVDVDAATVTSNRFLAYGVQSGFRRGAVAVPGSREAILTPTAGFRPGEQVFGHVTSGISNAPDTAVFAPRAWSFYAAAAVGSGTFFLHQSPANSGDAWDVALGDLDGDGDLDAFIGRYNSPNEVWLNDGAGTFELGQTLDNGPTRSIALADTDNDGDLDAAIVRFQAICPLWTNNGAGVFSNSGVDFHDANGSSAAFADIDGDGDQDFFRGAAFYYANIFRNDGGNVFTFIAGIGAGMAETLAPSFGDLNGDGYLDLYIGDGGAVGDWPDTIWLNDGYGGFAKYASVSDIDVTGTALGDLDGDGDLDAFVSRTSGNRVRLNNGKGAFTDSGQLLGSASSRDVALGDFDGDGDLDAFVANHGPNAIWINDGSGTFTDSGQSLGSRAGRAVAVGDLDGDGDLDAFVVNSGQNHEVWLNATVVRLTGEAGPHGAIAPSGTVEVMLGSSTTFVATADAYYHIGQLLTNGSPDSAATDQVVYSSVWANVTADSTVSVSFAETCAALGTPHWWLASYGLTNEGATFDEAETNDADGDACNARDERIADTGPTNGGSVFRVTGLAPTNSFAVTFSSTNSRVYSLEGCEILDTGYWLAVEGQTNVPGGAGGTLSLTDTNAAGRKAYRVRVSLP